MARRAGELGVTRAAAAVDLWAELHPEAVFAVGNAPTALLRMAELIEEGRLRPALVIGVPVGFVNVVESKERIWSVCRERQIPAIVAMGRKGGLRRGRRHLQRPALPGGGDALRGSVLTKN